MPIIKPRFLTITIIMLLSACGHKGGWITTVGPNYHSPALPTPTHWQAPHPMIDDSVIAHQGKLSDLTLWWQHFNDPVLNRLLTAAQQESASVASAKANIEQARGALIGSNAQFLPSIDSSLGSSYSSFSFGQAPFIRTQHMVSLQSNWEIDLFGGLARQQEAGRSQLEARHAAWHDARVAVAVEVANNYLNYRYCEIVVSITQDDANSRQASAKLIEVASNAGFRSASDVTLANASVAEGNNALLQQQAQCDLSIKSLVAITGLDERPLRQLLDNTPESIIQLPSPPPFQINTIPATVLRQRPDIAVAERNMAEASAKIGIEQANRYPKLSLSGNITPILQNMNGGAFSLAETWSIGPTLSLPLFDAGKRAANVDVAKAQYEAATSQFRATVRTAVKEVEGAMVRLVSVDQRLPEAHLALANYQSRFKAAEKLYTVGLGNLIDVETIRRNVMAAELAVQNLEHEKVSAWIALYRAVGGSWYNNDTHNHEHAPKLTHRSNADGVHDDKK